VTPHGDTDASRRSPLAAVVIDDRALSTANACGVSSLPEVMPSSARTDTTIEGFFVVFFVDDDRPDCYHRHELR
jgi:hypothetical protein